MTPEPHIANAELSPAAADRDAVNSARALADSPNELRGAALTVGGQAVSSATTFLRMVLLARVCSAADVGLYAMAFTAVMFMFAAHERLVESGYLIGVHRRERDQQRRLLGSTIVISLCFSFLGAAAVALAAAGSAALGNIGWIDGGTAMATALAAAAIAIPPIVFRELARSVACSHFDVVTAAAIDAVTFVAQVALLAILWQTGTLSVETTYLAIGASSLAACAWWAYSWRGKWTFDRSYFRADWAEIWVYSRWLLAARALGQGSRLLMPWLVAWYLGAAGAGVLAACVTLVGLSWIFVRGVNNYFRPMAVYAFQHGGPAALRRAVWRPSIFFSVLLGALCVLYAVAGDWLFEKVYGARQPDVWMVLVLQGLVTLAISLVAVASNGLAAIDRPQTTLWSEGVAMVITIAVALVMIPSSALVGASCAMLAGSAAGAIVAFALLERELRHLSIDPPRRNLAAELENYALSPRP